MSKRWSPKLHPPDVGGFLEAIEISRVQKQSKTRRRLLFLRSQLSAPLRRRSVAFFGLAGPGSGFW